MRKALGLVYIALGIIVAWMLGQFAESHKGVVKDMPESFHDCFVFLTPLAGTLTMLFLLIAGLVFLFKKPKPQNQQTESTAEKPREEEHPPQGSSKN